MWLKVSVILFIRLGRGRGERNTTFKMGTEKEEEKGRKAGWSISLNPFLPTKAFLFPFFHVALLCQRKSIFNLMNWLKLLI